MGQFYYLGVLNDISRSSIKFRDIYTVNFIVDQFKNHDKVLVVMGGLHAYAEEPALRAYFNNP